MNRLISILITLFVIFLVYIWINNVMSKKPESQVKTTSEELIDQPLDTDEEGQTTSILANDSETNTEGEKVDNQDKEDGQVESRVETPPITIPVNHKPPSPKPKVTKTSVQSQKKSTEPRKVKNAAQLHMVIAGNFSKRANAENRLKELQQNGYKNAEIVNFDLSEYYTVCAGRFEDLLEAKRISKKVRDYLNIEAYVRVGKQ